MKELWSKSLVMLLGVMCPGCTLLIHRDPGAPAVTALSETARAARSPVTSAVPSRESSKAEASAYHKPRDNFGGFAWTEPVNKLGRTCAQICVERDLICHEQCTTVSGYENWGAEAWSNSEQIEKGGGGGGQTSCYHVGDSGGIEPRWKCCCGKKESISRLSWSECISIQDRSCAQVCADKGQEAGLCGRPRFGIRTAYIRFTSVSACEAESWLDSVVEEGGIFDRESSSPGARAKCCCGRTMAPQSR